MSARGYKIRNPAAIHFITFVPIAIGIEWIDVFTRKGYRDIILESIRFWQAEKDWCCTAGVL